MGSSQIFAGRRRATSSLIFVSSTKKKDFVLIADV